MPLSAIRGSLMSLSDRHSCHFVACAGCVYPRKPFAVSLKKMSPSPKVWGFVLWGDIDALKQLDLLVVVRGISITRSHGSLFTGLLVVIIQEELPKAFQFWLRLSF